MSLCELRRRGNGKPQPALRVAGIYEPHGALVERYARQFGFDRRFLHTGFESMLDAIKPEAVVAFGSIAEHLPVVEAAAPRGVHVMVENALAFTMDTQKGWRRSRSDTAFTC